MYFLSIWCKWKLLNFLHVLAILKETDMLPCIDLKLGRYFLLIEIPMCNVVVRPPANHIPPTLDASSRGINGKRKLPSGPPPVYSPTASSLPTNSVPQFMNFAFEKRPCRPAVPMPKQEPNFTVNSFAGLSFVICSEFFCGDNE